MKQIIRLTEGGLRRIVKESVNRILENGYHVTKDGSMASNWDNTPLDLNGNYYGDDFENMEKREKAMMEYCQELIYACHSEGLLAELLKYLLAFEKQNGLDTVENNYFPLNRAPVYNMNKKLR